MNSIQQITRMKREINLIDYYQLVEESVFFLESQLVFLNDWHKSKCITNIELQSMSLNLLCN